MVDIVNHGGGCCGIAHIMNFDGTTLTNFIQVLSDRDAEGNRGRLLEAILSRRQVSGTDARIDRSIIDAGGWPQVLASQGFRLSAIWDNSNSGNRCYQFLRSGDAGAWVSTPGDAFPFPWNRFVQVPSTVDIPTLPDIPPPAPGYTDGRRSARVDPTLPVRLFVRELNRSYPARITSTGLSSIHVEVTGEHLEVPYGLSGANYRIDQGQWSGDPVVNPRARVFNVREDYEDAPLPAVVDPNLPVRIYSPPHLRSFETRVTDAIGQVIQARIVDPTYVRLPDQARNLTTEYSYVLTTGEWHSDPSVARLFNPPVTAAVAPATAPEPEVDEATTVLPVDLDFELHPLDAVFRARFRNGRMSLLRFDSVMELRERYPVVATLVRGNDTDGWVVIDEEDFI